ncbi:endo-1,4-beta-xylanase [Prevotella sp. E13-27]|uniref:endo-1,4-beta-xylanase n=1 Tax=Prevotella sp. E13-27 TaxID=2938122 RepID=UPI00200A189E|nr:endo-1,4-beta-xylanase [Prevotella sp. E13-27]MCK8623390.1 endo-1,4-beta-xylanase [Prevotella sp. E13-27]
MKKLCLLLFVAGLMTSAVAQSKFELGKPNDDNYRYLDDYLALKEYINHTAHPKFKLGIGTTVNDYLNNTLVKNLTNKNFTETVAGNAMKMGSCVDGNGNMNFTTVKNYVNAATNAGLNVYGHVLAWHSQQPKGWLLKLLADKPAPELTDGDVEVVELAASKDFRTNQSVGWKANESEYGFTVSFNSTDGLHLNSTKSYSYQVQFVGMDNIILQKGKQYKMTMTVKGSKSGKVSGRLGDWSGGASVSVPFTTAWQDVVVNVKPTMESSFLLMQFPNFVGDVYIKSIKFEAVKKGKTIKEERRCIKAHAKAKQSEAWDNQMWIVPGSFASGASYVFTADVRADKPAYASTQIHNAPRTYVNSDAFGNISFTTEWKTVTVSGKFSAAGQSIALNLSELADENNYYFDNVSLKINGTEKIKNGDLEGTDLSSFKVKEYGGSVVAPTVIDSLTYVYVPSSIPLTAQERHDTLVYAMDKWIKGMMNACNGKVKAWDLVNEAISGGGNDGSGNYTLQHSQGYNPDGTWDVGGDAFYWQDYMGDLEYVRQACRLARKYGPDSVVLFINDYNLESDWDGNKKLKSLINWIKKWEADSITKIDGIGTQMHISYYENSSTLSSKKSAITNMFKLMAATGKYVRVSELDMGYVNSSGNDVPTASMTEAQHKRMANYYEWIIKEFFRCVPASQQWGICHWCPTDSPEHSGWRANTPVGIWDLNYYRKHVYSGFVKGLGGVPNAIDDIKEDTSLDTSKGIYNLKGMRMHATSIGELPAGLYVVNGKKVVVK